MDSNNIKEGLSNFLISPQDPTGNFLLGNLYENIGQTASAISFYIRTAEFSYNNDLLTYEALLRTALCLEKQGSRMFVTKGIILRAVSLMPDRPEAYFLMSRIYERNKDWQEAYTWATVGETLFPEDKEYTPLTTFVEYPGRYGFTFEKAVVAWWIGLKEESLYLFKGLSKRHDLASPYYGAVKNNLANLWSSWKSPIRYKDSMYRRLKFKFKGAINLKQNYSQCYQDMFVLTMLNGKQNGKFFEIGCGDPFYGNNSALLEKEFGWAGTSIDINQTTVDKFKQHRSSEAICANALEIDYNKLLDGDYDYLQIDCDPSIVSLNVLKRIPFETHRFAVITFEHDFYNGDNTLVRDNSREYLSSMGYVLVVNNLAADKYYSFEDWWIHPDLVDEKIVNIMQDLSDKPKKADEYMMC